MKQLQLTQKLRNFGFRADIVEKTQTSKVGDKTIIRKKEPFEEGKDIKNGEESYGLWTALVLQPRGQDVS